ncbi:hypothetical protein C9374_010102 [Naegleria lovaniensis]|uniref:Uncharacterized protein n=1 Tax=Naegleria lovaniensis TaxID=51637 RepID=A0AA88GH58_NAELO|nr:uncharacterized protein C9374_010102 [Naegleria lovaniensis]KAG2375098.1 hypothetical protein C9374_010102 [Naegleria lovaniensis]
MYSVARRFTSSSNLASVYKAQSTRALFAKSAKFAQNTNNSHQLLSQVGVVQKAFSHDVHVNLQFGFENPQQVLDLLKEHGGKVEQTNKYTVTYYDSVPQDEVLSDASEYAKQRQSFEKYTMTSKDTWLFKITASDGSTTWKCTYPVSDEGKTHLDKPIVERAFAYNTANGEREIRRFLNLQQDMTSEARTGKKLATLDEDLRSRLGVVPFAKFDMTETLVSVSPIISYAAVNVALNEASFGYKLGSLNCHVNNATEEMAIDLATHLTRMMQSTKLNKLQTPYLRSVIQEYLYRHRPSTHYKVLLDVGIRDDKLMNKDYAREVLNASLEKRGLTPPAEEEEEEESK